MYSSLLKWGGMLKSVIAILNTLVLHSSQLDHITSPVTIIVNYFHIYHGKWQVYVISQIDLWKHAAAESGAGNQQLLARYQRWRNDTQLLNTDSVVLSVSSNITSSPVEFANRQLQIQMMTSSIASTSFFKFVSFLFVCAFNCLIIYLNYMVSSVNIGQFD